LPIDTLIPTTSGWKTMSKLTTEDILFDIDGNTTNIIQKSKAQYKDCYKIEFDDKTEVICDCDHLWLLDNQKTVQVTNLNINDKINLPKPINIDSINLPIDPYILGIWLGDGRNRSAEIT